MQLLILPNVQLSGVDESPSARVCRYSTCLRWSVLKRKPRYAVLIEVFLRIGQFNSPKKSLLVNTAFSQLIAVLVSEVICAVMMQDQSVGHVFASNHNYFLLPSVSLCVSAASVTQRQPVLSFVLSVCPCVLVCISVCLGIYVWLNYWCSVNPICLMAGATCAVCYVSVWCFCTRISMCALSESRKELCCN